MSETYAISLYPLIDKMEKEHFWFHARSAMVRRLVQTTIAKPQGKTFLEIGCGTGILLPVFTDLGFQVTGVDVNARALYYAKKQSHATLIKSSLHSYKPKKQYDAIGIFDILEHQKDDQAFLSSCHRLLRKDGYLFISVPAHQWLWNVVDDVSGHVRRYEINDLTKKLEKAGFYVEFAHYWNFLLLGFYILWRLQYMFRKGKSKIETYFMIPARPINIFCRWILTLEEQLFFWLPFPTGSSLIVVARKR